MYKTIVLLTRTLLKMHLEFVSSFQRGVYNYLPKSLINSAKQ